jgi:hypothetical protein
MLAERAATAATAARAATAPADQVQRYTNPIEDNNAPTPPTTLQKFLGHQYTKAAAHFLLVAGQGMLVGGVFTAAADGGATLILGFIFIVFGSVLAGQSISLTAENVYQQTPGSEADKIAAASRAENRSTLAVIVPGAPFWYGEEVGMPQFGAEMLLSERASVT